MSSPTRIPLPFYMFQFFWGWWVAIDAAVIYPDKGDLKDVFHICGVFATISMVKIVAYIIRNKTTALFGKR